MEYNSQKDELIISEYGRNVQNLISFAKTVEDREERQLVAESIIDLMYLMNPSNKSNEDYKDKLWRHFFRIAEYDIDVAPPTGEIPTREYEDSIKSSITYPSKVTAYRHYGQYVKSLITKALEEEDKEKQDEFCMIIASYMKLAYRTWNKEHYVSDDVIKEDLVRLSKGGLSIKDEDTIDVSAALSKEKRKQRPGGKRQGGRNNNQRAHKGGRRRR